MKLQKYGRLCITVGLLCGFILFSCKSAAPDQDNTVVRKGCYSAANMQTSEIVNLKGEWIFVPNRFIDPKEDIFRYERFEKINERWSSYTDPLSAHACASYAIKITDFIPNAMYALKLNGPSSACTVYLDGEAFFNSGKAATSAAEEIFHWGSNVVVLPLKGKTEAVLVFHISNFSDKNPGFLKPVQLGFYEALYESHNRTVTASTSLAGILILLSVFFLSLFIFYSKLRLALYFSMLGFVFGLRVFCYDEFLLTTVLPFISSVTLHRIGYITLSGALIFVSLFIHELLYKKRFYIIYTILSPALLYIPIIIFTPMTVYSNLLPYMQIYTLVTAVYNVAVLTHGAIRRKKYAPLFLLGTFLFLLLAVWDILIANGVVKGVFVAQFGILALLIPMSMIVLESFKSVFESVSNMTKQVERVNTSLSRFLPNEFMSFLQKRHTDVNLGDNNLENMYIAFVYLGVHADLGTRSERLSVLELYNAILAVIAPVIKKYRGFIDKYLTEGLMIIFHGTAEEALCCLLEIERFVQTESARRSAKHLKEITLACGIHYGQVLLGTIGEPERMDNTVISDAVNVASRLHFYALENGIGILASETVKKKCTDSASSPIDFTHSTLVSLRGKDKPLVVYEVHNA